MRDPCGMTLRDWFAGKALVGELGSQSPEIGEWPNSQLKGLAERCYCIADAMLVERAKE
jgi:DNA-binding transcriptional regulator YdaS (Cro superfamily)